MVQDMNFEFQIRFVERQAICMGYAGNHIIEFVGKAFSTLDSYQEFFVTVDGVSHKLLPKTLSKFKNISNAKEYAEAIEYFAYLVLIKKSVINDAYFSQ